MHVFYNYVKWIIDHFVWNTIFPRKARYSRRRRLQRRE